MKDYPERPEISLATVEPNSSLAWIATLVGDDKRVLDVGCATGYQAALLTERSCVTTGIEISADAAEAARARCAAVFVADIEATPIPHIVSGATFDAIVFGDVLEHVRDPARVLREARAALAPGGFVVASIPNVAHGAVRIALLQGDFDYQTLGLLDDTHVRFFTRKTVDALFATAGYTVERLERVTLDVFEDSDLLPKIDRTSLDPDLAATIEAAPEARTLQFVVRARPVRVAERTE